MRDGVCSFHGQVLEQVERAGAAVVAGCLLAKVLGDLFSGKWLASFVVCVGERVFVDGVSVLVGDVGTVLVKLRFIAGKLVLASMNTTGL